MLTKFQQKYLEVLANSPTDSDNWYQEPKIPDKPFMTYFKTLHILNEYVEDPELTPVPREIMIHILPKLKTRQNNVLELTYKELYDLLDVYNYQYSEEFKENLDKLNKFKLGKVYIAVLDNNEQILHQYLDDYFDPLFIFQKVIPLMEEKSDGVTTSWNKNLFNPTIKDKDILILINRDLIKYDQTWKDTFEHQLTHFVQRVVGLDKSLKSSLTYLGPNNALIANQKLKKLIENINSKTNVNKSMTTALLKRFITYILQAQQIHPIVKTTINAIQRLYEQSQLTFKGTKFSYNYKKLQDRNIWLDNFLQKLVVDQHFITLFDKYIQKNKLDLSLAELREYNQMMVILTCLIYECLDYPIENKIKEHFKTFKLRDL